MPGFNANWPLPEYSSHPPHNNWLLMEISGESKILPLFRWWSSGIIGLMGLLVTIQENGLQGNGRSPCWLLFNDNEDAIWMSRWENNSERWLPSAAAGMNGYHEAENDGFTSKNDVCNDYLEKKCVDDLMRGDPDWLMIVCFTWNLWWLLFYQLIWVSHSR